jgi:hypothetical protein
VACLVCTTEQLEREFARVFGDGEAVPEKLWIDHWHDDATFIRAVYDDEFPSAGADRLLVLRNRLQSLYGTTADVTIVIFLEDADWQFFAAHRLSIHLAR